MNKAILEKKGHVSVLKINSPETLNALNAEVINDINECLNIAEKDDDTYVVIITGEGRSFVAGADITEMLPMTGLEGAEWGRIGGGLMRRVETFFKPVIAAVNGFALGGGCELAMGCDFIYASDKAKLGLPEVGLGVIPGFGGTQRLPRAIGIRKAKEFAYTASILTAEQAYEVGLVNKVCKHETLLDEALEAANKIVAQSQVAVREFKRCANIGTEIDISASMELEAQAFGVTFSSEDKKIGMGAFVNKEKGKQFVNR